MARLGLFHCRCRAYTLKNPRATSTGGGAPILSLLVYGYWLLYKVQIIALLETAEELTTSSRKLRQIAETLGANTKQDEELDDWLTSLEDELYEED